MKKVVIIGGGFCGTICAINLARLSPVPLHISIIDKSHLPCRGIAYATRNPQHLLNVAARNMSALADQPHHFVEWLRTRSEYLDESDETLRSKFVPRQLYGDYLHNLFQWYAGALSSEKGQRLDYFKGEIDDIIFGNKEASVILGGGRTLAADKVILAVGNQAPASLPLPGLDVESWKYIGNPWLGWEEKLPSLDRDILLVGTGLTMADTFLTLQNLGWRGRILALSRNGLLPLSHFKGFDYPDFVEEENLTVGLRRIFSVFKKHHRILQSDKLNPTILIDKLRPVTQRIWQSFSLREKKQFNRHFRTRWNVKRHRLAPEVHQQLSRAIAQGRLEIIKGRLLECRESADQLSIEAESGGGKRIIKVGALINCTGPEEGFFPSKSLLFKNLISRGAVAPDQMNMGIQTTPDYSVINREGNRSETLFALGGILKGSLWETTAVPELRSQAFRIAETIAAQLSEANSEKSPISEVLEDVLEYSI
jgi:uncharacterized NAD(P)/FAD-binding protein YdhS